VIQKMQGGYGPPMAIPQMQTLRWQPRSGKRGYDRFGLLECPPVQFRLLLVGAITRLLEVDR